MTDEEYYQTWAMVSAYHKKIVNNSSLVSQLRNLQLLPMDLHNDLDARRFIAIVDLFEKANPSFTLESYKEVVVSNLKAIVEYPITNLNENADAANMKELARSALAIIK